MRPGMILTLALSWLVLTVTTQPLSAKSARAGVGAASKPAEVPVLKVEGRWQTTEADAWRSADAEVHLALIDHFREQGLVFLKPPTMPELRPVLARQWKPTPETKSFPEGVGLMHRIVLDVPVTPEVKSFLVQKKREVRMQDRMLWLGQIMAGLVVLLTAAAGYFRLDEWTKGYYTTWLRMAALGFIGTSAVLLLLAA